MVHLKNIKTIETKIRRSLINVEGESVPKWIVWDLLDFENYSSVFKTDFIVFQLKLDSIFLICSLGLSF